jgi:malonate transporter and related proteins
MTLILLNALLPIFVGLLLGYIAGRRRVMDNLNVRNLIVLVMDFAIPCALFSTISSTSWTVLREQWESATMIAGVFVSSYAASYIWARKSLKMSISDASVLALTVGFPNSAAVALPLLTTAYGPSSRVTAALSITVGAITISPLTVALLESDKLSDGKGVSITAVAIKFLRAFARPVVWAPMLGLVSVYFGLHLPSYVDRSLTILGSAASGSALILTGIVVSSQTFCLDGKVAWATAAIVLIQPLFALGITELFHMSHAEICDITLISAIPGGFFGLVFGKSFNSTPETASSALLASYCVGAFAMAGWMLVITKYV